MKRMWIGAAVLLVLLVGSFLVGKGLEKRIHPHTTALRQAAAFAQAGQWEQAESLTEQARTDWEQLSWVSAMLARHDDLDRIGTGFAQFAAYAGTDAVEYSALCIDLAEAIDALGQTHACEWKNFF